MEEEQKLVDNDDSSSTTTEASNPDVEASVKEVWMTLLLMN